MSAPAERPPKILTAIKLLWLRLAMGLLAVALSWSYYTRTQSPITVIVFQVIGAAVFLWVCGKIYAGRNWARILLLISWLLIVAGSLTPVAWRVYIAMPMVPRTTAVLGVLIEAYVLWVLFISPAKVWFRKSRASTVV